jgi:hypothetical protein
MAEIPTHVLVPPNRTPRDREEAWRKRQPSDGPGIEVVPGSCLPNDLVYDLNLAMRSTTAYLPADENYLIRLREELHEAISNGDKERAKKLLGEVDSMQKHIERVYQSAGDRIRYAKLRVDGYINNRRQILWGDPDMPDLGLHIDEYDILATDASSIEEIDE